jgi:carbohydrate-selective porin OprB
MFAIGAVASRLDAAPPAPIQQPIPTLGLGTTIDQEFKKLTNFGITPFIAYYGVFQGNPVGRIQQQTAYSHLLLFGATLNFDKLIGIPGGFLIVSGAEALGKDLSDNGNPTSLFVNSPFFLTANYTIQPDIQYIIRPNGTNEAKNSVVLGVQFTANF